MTLTTSRETVAFDPLPDVQSGLDARRIPINKVGVKEIRYPIALQNPEGRSVHSVANINMYVSLPAERKGTHMSRFLEVLQEYAHDLRPEQCLDLCEMMRRRLDANDAFVELEFPYFIEKYAPVTQKPGLMDYTVTLRCVSNGTADLVTSVAVPATSLCPCSKQISAYGAHNQRCLITADIRSDAPVSIEELVEMVEGAASCEVYSLLKQPDEKHVTEQAYRNPKFVEDIVRDVSVVLNGDDRITWYHVRSENFESIHSHNAYAEIECTKA